MSLSYFLSNAFADGVDSLDSSKLVAEPVVDDKIKYSYSSKSSKFNIQYLLYTYITVIIISL